MEGIVRISAAPGMADIFLVPALARLHARHPKIAIELDASVAARDLTRHEAEIAVRSLRPQGADLVVTKLGTGQWNAAGSASLVKELGRLASWNDAPWIAWDRDLASFAPARWLSQHAPKAAIPLRTSHFASQLAAARAGVGLALAPAPYIKAYNLVPVRYAPALASSADAWPVDDLWLVGHRALRDVPRVAIVWEHLAKDLRASIP